MFAIQRVGSMLLVSLLAACGSADEPKPPPPVEDTVFRDTVAPIDKAKNVENVVMEQKRDVDQAVDESEH